MPPTSPLDAISPGLKVAAQVQPEASDNHLRFIAQMGVSQAVLWTGADARPSAHRSLRRTRVRSGG